MRTTKKFKVTNLVYGEQLCKCTHSYLNDSLYLTSGNHLLASIKQLKR